MSYPTLLCLDNEDTEHSANLLAELYTNRRFIQNLAALQWSRDSFAMQFSSGLDHPQQRTLNLVLYRVFSTVLQYPFCFTAPIQKFLRSSSTLNRYFIPTTIIFYTFPYNYHSFFSISIYFITLLDNLVCLNDCQIKKIN